ncbi:MAG: hypothetical protein AUK48_06890 [Oscillatoriales cyanobacterium CG2_30_44_21]|nr:MAG: hypothetical protein AUK48_06890 [Oscillatoriales cyanobacterium CG2_30_44_21]
MKKNLSGLLFTAAIATVVTSTSATLSSVSVEAATFNFGNISELDRNGNEKNVNGDAIVGQFNFSVVDGTGANANRTIWTFNNAGPAVSFINEIYFEGITSILNNSIFSAAANGAQVSQLGSTSGSVLYQKGATPKNLPQGGNISFDSDLALDVVGSEGSGKNGVDAGESLVLFFTGLNASGVEAKINSGDIRVGMHVKGIASTGGGSDSFVNNKPTVTTPPTKPVPVPGFVLGILAAGALGGKRLLSKKQAV